MSFRSLDTLVDAHQSVTTKVFVGGTLVHQNLSAGVDRPWRIYSITKSVVSMLVGIAEGDGLLTLDDRVAQYVPEWRGSDSAEVTIRQLLSMTSGRETSEVLDDEMTSIADDKTAFAVSLGQAAVPGSTWHYDNLAAQVLEPVLTAVTGDLIGFAHDRLFSPVGMGSVDWQRDAVGNPLTYAGITATADQLGVLGQLVIDHGRFDGRQIVPESFLAASTSPSSELNASYGYLWWTNATGERDGDHVAVGAAPVPNPQTGCIAPAVPGDTVWGLGWGSQMAAIVPSRKMVAIRFGRRPRYPETFTLEAFTAAALEGVR